MVILIADDSDAIRERLVQTFSEIAGVDRIITASTINDTILMLKEEPDYLLLDLRFPKGSGLDVINHVNKNNIRTVIIVLTNYPYPQFRQRCLDLGVEYFFDKTTQFNSAVKLIMELALQNNSLIVE